VVASNSWVGSRSGTRSSASLNAGTSMSESTPNSSRTLAILSGAAISVSAPDSGSALGRSVIPASPEAKAPRASTNRDFIGQREQRSEALRQLHIALDPDHLER